MALEAWIVQGNGVIAFESQHRGTQALYGISETTNGTPLPKGLVILTPLAARKRFLKCPESYASLMS
jgi:hypothetical protein